MIREVLNIDDQIQQLEDKKKAILKKYEAYTGVADRCKAVLAEVDKAIADSGLDKQEFYLFCGLPSDVRGRKHPVKTYKNPIKGQPNIVCGRLTKELIEYREKHGIDGLNKLLISTS